MTRQINVEQLSQELCAAVRHGARAPRLFEHHPALVNRLAPPARQDAPESLITRAFAAEQVIRTAIAQIGGRTAEALTVALGLRGDEILYRTAERRRREAARICGMQPTTWRQRHEALLLWDLSFQICSNLLTQQQAG